MTVPGYDHIVIAVMENHDYGEIIGNTQAPYINALAAGGALLSNYTAISHPSQPNYFALYAGSTFGTADDNQHSEPDPTLDTILQAAGKSFTGYVEQSDSDFNHNPWESFPEGFSVEKDFSSFPSSNFAALPNVSFVIPNLTDDMHNGTIQQGDNWLKANLDGYAQWAKANNSLLIVVWDEGDVSQNNQVAAIFYGAHVAPGTYNTAYNHYNLLSTVLAAFNLTGPRNASTASPINVFQSDPTAICFLSGTLIRTPDGEVAIETLKRGDLVISIDGRPLPVSWVGRQRISQPFADPMRVLPIRIRAGALSDGTPQRDLLVSPDHAILVGGVLIQAAALINGSSIVREANIQQTITYYHLELDEHSLIFAENTPAETFVDNVDRLAFDNWPEHEALYSQGKCIPEMPYARAKAYRQVPRFLRERLAERGRHLYGARVQEVA